MKKLLVLVGLIPATLFAAGIQKVEVQVDNQPFALANGLENWTSGVDTTLMDNGPHMLMAKATDLSGNVSPAAMVTFRVNNLSALRLEPSAKDILVGETFTLQIRMDTKIKVNAAQVILTFPPNLEALSIDNNGSAFGILANKKLEPGKASISLGNITSVMNDQLVANITFRAATKGSADVIIINDGSNDGSLLLRESNSKNVLTSVSGGTFNLIEVADITPPTVDIIEPLENEEVSGFLGISGTAEDK